MMQRPRIGQTRSGQQPVFELLVGGTPRAARLAARIQHRSESLHAPQLVDLEVASVLRGLGARNLLSPALPARAIVDRLGAAG